MAYYDGSGKITIDELAANRDINYIVTAKQSLNESLNAIGSVIRQASSQQGQASVAIVDRAEDIRRSIQAMIERLTETETFIRRTVAHYRILDAELKKTIESSGNHR